MREKTNEIIWVFGGSAAGKEIFIKYIIENRPNDLIRQLGWENKKIVTCAESIEWIAQSEDDPNIQKRFRLPEVISKKNSKNVDTVILIKGQDLDLVAKRPERIKSDLPEEIHKIIYIDTDVKEVFERIKEKPWWESSITEKVAESWINNQLALLHNLSDNFDIVTLGGNRGDNYKFIPSLPR